jgi:hypothetical protein
LNLAPVGIAETVPLGRVQKRIEEQAGEERRPLSIIFAAPSSLRVSLRPPSHSVTL